MNKGAIRILGVDPGLRNTGWGLIESVGSRLIYIACGSIHTETGMGLAERLARIHRGLAERIEEARSSWARRAASRSRRSRWAGSSSPNIPPI